MAVEVGEKIPKHYVDDFNETLIRSQQMRSRFLGRTLVNNTMGKATHFDQLGSVDAEEDNTFAPKSPHMEIPHFRRKLTPRRFHVGHVIDEHDVVQVLTDPTSKYSLLFSAAMARRYDSVGIVAATGNAIVENADGTTVTIALPSTQKVGIQVGSASGAPVDTNLNEEKVRTAIAKIQDNNVDTNMPENELIGFISPNGYWKGIMVEDRFASRDFNTTQPLADGMVVSKWLGVTWVISTQLLVPATNHRTCFIYAKSGIGYGIWTPISSDFAKRADLSFSNYLYSVMRVNATRLEEEKVMEITIDETKTPTGL